MVNVGFRHISNLKGDPGRKGDKGDTGVLAFLDANAVAPDRPAAARMKTDGRGTGAVVDVPRGLPGVNSVPSDEFIATVIGAGDTETNAALRRVVPTVVAIGQFIEEGETLDASGGQEADNTAIIQRAVDHLSSAYASDGKPRQVYFPDGTYLLKDVGGVPGGSSAARYAVRWRSGVGIATSSRRGVIFVAPPTATAFVAAYEWGNLSHVYCDPHVVDGYRQTRSAYTAQLKCWYIQGLADSHFDDVCVRNSFSTGWGCDFLQRTLVTGEADNCGRGMRETGINPLTSSGASGFGIGTGRYAVEDFTVDVVARNCGFHGVFLETQSGGEYLHSKGGRIRALVEGNYIGFRDCGSDGLQAEITARKNEFAEIYHARTVLNNVVGINGNVNCDLSDGRNGIVFGPTGVSGPYKFSGDVRRMYANGVIAEQGSVVPQRLELDMTIHDNAGSALRFEESVAKAVFRVREWNNGSIGLGLLGANKSAADLAFYDCDFRSTGVQITQQPTGEWVVSDSTRGISGTAPVVRAWGTGSNTVHVRWTPPGSRPVSRYRIQYRLAGGEWQASSFDGIAQDWDLVGLPRGRAVEVRVGHQEPWGGTTVWSESYVAVAGVSNVLDRFERANGPLEGTTLPDGAVTPAWQAVTSGTGRIETRQKAAGGVATPVGGTPAFALFSPGTQRVTIQVSMPSFGTDAASRRFGLVFGFADPNNYWRAGVSAGDGRLTIARLKNGSAFVASTGPVPNRGDVLRVEVDTVDGATHYAWFVNGSLVESVEDATEVTVGRVGITGSASTDSDAQFDDFTAWV